MVPHISIIAAMTRNRIIGRNNELPWHLPADLKHFKALTMGKPIIMGRKTWESLPGLLPGRQHIVVTRNPDYVAEDATIALSLDEAIAAAGDVPEVMIIGGANVYQQAIEIADTLYITKIDTEVDGDASFPPLDKTVWKQSQHEPHTADEKNPYDYSFITYRRI
ncbi:type 3 dihydrofolate reductase [Solemya velum gill symbiont]|uniref:Dihydrofolate reductase n=3 Tax=sulfur-oxidizing symbionts TaxID=32036 RepID=A0A0B0HCT6_SOVGS|nr:type 3 dihydrofolate reductase [Solemya velum gill symbiont]KHF25281.1 dihydrofolate reductase [Solemya velum gill symbiont]